jgi:hypothetical protein
MDGVVPSPFAIKVGGWNDKKHTPGTVKLAEPAIQIEVESQMHVPPSATKQEVCVAIGCSITNPSEPEWTTDELVPVSFLDKVEKTKVTKLLIPMVFTLSRVSKTLHRGSAISDKFAPEIPKEMIDRTIKKKGVDVEVGTAPRVYFVVIIWPLATKKENAKTKKLRKDAQDEKRGTKVTEAAKVDEPKGKGKGKARAMAPPSGAPLTESDGDGDGENGGSEDESVPSRIVPPGPEDVHAASSGSSTSIFGIPILGRSMSNMLSILPKWADRKNLPEGPLVVFRPYLPEIADQETGKVAAKNKEVDAVEITADNLLHTIHNEKETDKLIFVSPPFVIGSTMFGEARADVVSWCRSADDRAGLEKRLLQPATPYRPSDMQMVADTLMNAFQASAGILAPLLKQHHGVLPEWAQVELMQTIASSMEQRPRQHSDLIEMLWEGVLEGNCPISPDGPFKESAAAPASTPTTTTKSTGASSGITPEQRRVIEMEQERAHLQQELNRVRGECEQLREERSTGMDRTHNPPRPEWNRLQQQQQMQMAQDKSGDDSGQQPHFSHLPPAPSAYRFGQGGGLEDIIQQQQQEDNGTPGDIFRQMTPLDWSVYMASPSTPSSSQPSRDRFDGNPSPAKKQRTSQQQQPAWEAPELEVPGTVDRDLDNITHPDDRRAMTMDTGDEVMAPPDGLLGNAALLHLQTIGKNVPARAKPSSPSRAMRPMMEPEVAHEQQQQQDLYRSPAPVAESTPKPPGSRRTVGIVKASRSSAVSTPSIHR